MKYIPWRQSRRGCRLAIDALAEGVPRPSAPKHRIAVPLRNPVGIEVAGNCSIRMSGRADRSVLQFRVQRRSAE